jgi:uncharacterized membrane protein
MKGQTKPPRARSRPEARLLLAIIILAAALVRLAFLTRTSLIFDELYNIMVDRLSLSDLMREALAAGHPPLYYLLARVWYLAGTGEFWARSLSVAAGLLTVLLTYALGRELFERRTSLLAAALAAFSPFLVWYSRTVIYYSWVAPLALLSLYFLVRSARRGGLWNWLGYLAATVAVFLVYFYAAAILLAGLPLYWLLRDGRRSSRAAWLLSQAALLPAVLLSYYFSRQATSADVTGLGWPRLDQLKNLAKGLAAAPAVLMGGEQVDITAGGWLAVRWLALLALLLTAAVVAVLASRGLRERFLTRESVALAVFVVLMTVLPLAVQYVRIGSMLGRYYIWAVPPLMLLIAFIIERAPGRLFYPLSAVTLLLLLAVSVAGYGHRADSDWRTIMAMVNAGREEGDAMLCFHVHQCEIAAGYYMEEPMPVHGGFLGGPDEVFFMPAGEAWDGYASGYWAGTGATPALKGGEVSARLASDLAGARRLWVVSGDICPQYPGICDYLDGSWRQVDRWQKDFVTVRLYQRRE